MLGQLFCVTHVKTGKTAVLPGFCRVELGGGGSDMPLRLLALPAKNLALWPRPWGMLAGQQ